MADSSKILKSSRVLLLLLLVPFLSTEAPLLYVTINRKSPFGINFFVDETLLYVTAENRVLQMEILRENLAKHLPKVPRWLRFRQNKYHELLFDPLLLKYHHVKVIDLIWCLPDGQ